MSLNDHKVLLDKETLHNTLWADSSPGVRPDRAKTPWGGTLFFSAYVGSDPASTVHPKKYQEFQAPQKYLKF